MNEVPQREWFSLHGQVAAVTGAGAGIGEASARALARAGAAVVVSDRTLEGAQTVAESLVLEGCRAIAVECDVFKDEQLVNLVDQAVAQFGGLNILVNNVGGGGGGKENVLEESLDDIQWAFQFNLFHIMRLIQLAAPHMQRAGTGSIVNISSMSSVTTQKHSFLYGSAKAAMNQMTKYLAVDLGPEIRVNAVAPGAIKTAALASVLTPEAEQTMLANTPMGRLGEPDDIAAAVLYFAAPASRWVSGQILFVNGGGEQTLD